MQLNHPIVDPCYNYALSQVFGASLVKRLDDSVHEDSIRSLLHHCGLYPVNEQWNFVHGLSIAYQYLRENYRCEYVYKNEIANQILLRYHSDNSATLLREVASDRSIADIVIINGQTVAYEIKTELDNFDRLAGQLGSYQCLYDCLNIVTHRGAVDAIYQKVDETVGIIVLNDDAKIETLRPAVSTAHLFDPAKAVVTLRQAELVAAYEKWVGKMPKMGTALIYTFCHEWYLGLDIEEAHIVFAQALKSRRPNPHQFNLILDCDTSLRMLFFGRELSKRYCVTARERLGLFE
ncbi:sce7726 family protein [Hymenobacter sp.]|jgi:hypothetical protein|uniref:sce7726 family protein n=1 Tax=Hymenobacter sp. TaxID=1898978 RepID=UPI002ED79A14